MPLSSLLADAVQEAVRRAADPRAFPEQLDLGLQAWKVQKLYGVKDGSSTGVTQDNDEPRMRLQATVRDFAATAHALLTDRYVPLPKQRTHDLVWGRKEKSLTGRHLMAGLEETPGETKRDVKMDDKTDPDALQMIVKRRSAVALAENLDNPARTLAMVPTALEKLPASHAAPAAFAIAGQFAERGQWYLAQEVYLYMIDRYPAHPLSAEAHRWLIRLNTSGEARRRNDLKHFAIAERLGIVKEKILKVGNVEGEPAAEKEPLTSSADVRLWNKGTLELSKRLGAYGSIYALDPGTQYCLHVAQQQLGDVKGARDGLMKFCKWVPSGLYHEAARAELRHSHDGVASSRRPGRCRYTEVRPYLDGKFDDPCWQDLKPMVLDNAVAATTDNYRTEAMFAFDQEFLYIALKCTHPSGQSFVPVKPRRRDADLDPFDRVSILLDLDRDYATYYHLEVDQRGCVRDSCWGDRSWNPRWFVAVHSTDTCWQIEAAIPLSELTGQKITQSTAWAFNLVRILPGRGVQSWTQPADVRPRPEGMSLLLFHTGTTRPMMKAP